MKSISIKTSLLSIAILTLFLSIGVGTLAITKMKVLNDGANKLYDDIIPGIKYAEKLSIAIGSMRIGGAAYYMASTDEERERVTKVRAEAVALFKSSLVEYKKVTSLHPEEDEKLVAKVEDIFGRYSGQAAQYLGLVKAGSLEEARAIYTGEMKKLYDEMEVAVNDLIKLNEKDASITNDRNDATFAGAKKIVMVAVALLIGCSVLLLLIALSAIIRPIARTAEAMTVLAGGDMESEIPYIDRTNELGTMAKAVQVFKDNMIKAKALEAEQASLKVKAEAERRVATLKMADDLETAVGQVIQTVSSSSTQMQASAKALTGTAERASQQSHVVSEATRNASANVQTVAAATEELSSSILEISTQINRSAKFSSETVQSASEMNHKIQSLISAVDKIGSVVDIINNIASQINLLALNATIEAARAGDAGRGFAVVASEVKALASGTAKATEEIKQQIGSIQSATQDSASAITAISATIDEMDKISQSIAAAVEEQSAATKDISRNVQEAASGTQQVSQNIVEVSRATEETGAAASQILNASDALAGQSVVLRNEVTQFLQRVRAA